MAGASSDRAPKDQTRSRTDWLVDRAVGAAIQCGHALPVTAQARMASGLARAGFARQKTSAKHQLDHAWPELTPKRRNEIALGAVENVLRGTLEIADGQRLLRRARDWAPQGPGLSELDAAIAQGRGAILVTGHFGNWEAARAALTLRGHSIGGLYRPLNNGYLNDRWTAILSGLSGPVFPRGRQGLRGLLRFLKGGGVAVMLPDQFAADGTVLEFLGRPAPTSLATAELALKFKLPLIPFYGIRRGHDFDVQLEAPIPVAAPEVMMQSVNDSLAARIRDTPEQWLWTHRRWKPNRVQRMAQKDATE